MIGNNLTQHEEDSLVAQAYHKLERQFMKFYSENSNNRNFITKKKFEEEIVEKLTGNKGQPLECPITMGAIEDPVIIISKDSKGESYAHFYEKAAIVEFFKSKKDLRDPCTRGIITQVIDANGTYASNNIEKFISGGQPDNTISPAVPTKTTSETSSSAPRVQQLGGFFPESSIANSGIEESSFRTSSAEAIYMKSISPVEALFTSCLALMLIGAIIEKSANSERSSFPLISAIAATEIMLEFTLAAAYKSKTTAHHNFNLRSEASFSHVLFTSRENNKTPTLVVEMSL